MGLFKNGNLSAAAPFYVTRPHGARKVTGALTMSIWMQLAVVFVIWLNIIGWGIYGLVELVGKVVG